MSSKAEWLDRVPVQNEDAAWRMVDDECIIVMPETAQATVLNPVAARIWELMDGKRSLGQIVETIVSEYDVDSATAEKDASDFVNELTTRGLMGYQGGAD